MTHHFLAAVARLCRRAFKRGAEQQPAVEFEQDHRDRNAYEAEIAKVEHDKLSAKDEAEVAELRAFVEEIGSGEFPTLAFDADPLGAPIPEGHLVAEPEFFTAVTADWLSVFSWTAPSRVPLVSVQVAEPEAVEIEGPTGVFSKDWIARVMADAEAKASTQ